MSNEHSKPVKVFMVCSGLGHVSRGFESFTQECFDALSDDPRLEITLFKGGGQNCQQQRVLRNLPRNSSLSSWLGKTLRKNGYWLEQVTFTMSLLPHIIRQKPDVIYFSDCNIGNLLWHWRRTTRRHFKLLFSNGGPLTPPFPRWDHVQQVAPSHLEAASAAGQVVGTQSLVPYGICMEGTLPLLPADERTRLRRALNLPVDKFIVLSVGAINKSHKRMDYVIREIAALPVPRPYLVLLGQQDEETAEIRTIGDEVLGADSYRIQTVPHHEVGRYYQTADAFVLASLHEGFGRVFLEAMSWGVLCLAHDYALTRYILDTSGLMADFEQPGSLTGLICRAMEDQGLPAPTDRHRMAFDHFSWAHLRPEYVALLQKCATS